MFEHFEKSPDEPVAGGPDGLDGSEPGGLGGVSLLERPAPAATQAGPLTPQDLIDFNEWASSDDLA